MHLVVAATQPANRQRFRIVVVMPLSLRSATDLAGLGYEHAMPARLRNRGSDSRLATALDLAARIATDLAAAPAREGAAAVEALSEFWHCALAFGGHHTTGILTGQANSVSLPVFPTTLGFLRRNSIKLRELPLDQLALRQEKFPHAGRLVVRRWRGRFPEESLGGGLQRRC